MTKENLIKAISDYRTIWLGVASLVSAAVWAADQRYMPKEDSDKLVSVIEIRQLTHRNSELEIQRAYETDDQQIKMLGAMIQINRNKIQGIIDEKQIEGIQ